MSKPRQSPKAAERAKAAAVAARIREAGARARAEAEARRVEATEGPEMAPELGGRNGPEPTRYGDWEKKGVISDF